MKEKELVYECDTPEEATLIINDLREKVTILRESGLSLGLIVNASYELEDFEDFIIIKTRLTIHG